MTRQEALAIMAMLKTAYPSFYKDFSKEELNAAVNLWATMFSQEPIQVVTEAIKALMCTLKYPPTIADVKEKIELLTQPARMTEMEAWHLVKKAMNTSDFVSAFRSLPPEIRRIVGSPDQLKEWAYMDIETVNSVIQSNFMRSFRVVAEREREFTKLPESAKQLMIEASKNLKMIE
jgi:hypothetical protein